MKTQRIFLFLLINLINGCSAEEHIKFENIPINGNVDAFAKELSILGFSEPQLTEKNQIRFKGVFLDKNCEICIFGTSKSQTAYKVRVNLPAEVQDSLESTFVKIQMLYTSKYGIGTNKYKKHRVAERFLFNEPKRIRHLSAGDYTRYKTDSGEITIEVQEGYISITYLDRLNDEIRKKEMEESKPVSELYMLNDSIPPKK